MPKFTRKQKYRALDKLMNAGFNDEKTISELKIKDISKIRGLLKQDMDIIADIQNIIGQCKNVSPLLKYLSDDEMEVE